MATFDASVRRALEEQPTLDHAEHCSCDPDQVAAMAVEPGAQIRLQRSDGIYALYTISETRDETNAAVVRLGPAARSRLDAPTSFEATIDTRVTRSELSDEKARAQSEFVERLTDYGSQRWLVAIAPHGGSIEPHTDAQAERVGTVLGSDRASVWRCRGFKSGGGAVARWHITSTDIHAPSFPLLQTIADRGFTYAVAFHGFTGEDVIIGGAADDAIKEAMVEAISPVLDGSGIAVRLATASDGLNGNSPRNIVNRLTAGGRNGVQIEQPRRARDDYGEAIATAVAKAFDRL